MRRTPIRTLFGSSMLPFALAPCLGLSAGVALGQAMDEAGKSVEEVVVSARRREESLQEVPIAVSAYTGDALDEVGTADIIALSQSTPNLTLEVSRATSSTLTAFIRGVGQQDPLAGFEGGVGLYLDDVYLARPQGTVFDVYDVERIEVLRGPQGTLYGRNTIGGAIKYVTRRLSQQPGMELKLGVGTFDQADAVVTASTPLSDNLRIGGTVATFNRDGFGDNVFTQGEHYDKNITAYRLSAEWEAADNWFFRLAGDYSDDDSSPKSGHRVVVSNLTNAAVLDDVFNTRAGIETIPSSNGGLGQEVTQGGISLLAEWTIDDNWSAKSITAYREDSSDSLIDFDSLPGNDFDAPVVYDNDQFSQEFQFTYQNDAMAGIFGIYYLKANAFDAFDVVLGNLGVTSFTLGDIDTDSWAVFGDLSYDLNEAFSVSVGARYTSDERTATITRETFLGAGSPYFGNTTATSLTVPVPGLLPTFNGSRTDKDFTPRVSVSWHPMDEHNLYLAYSQGFKGGGYDPRGAFNFPAVQSGYEPETVDSFELGAKSIWGGGNFSTNAALFFSDYQDVQVPGSVAIDSDGDGTDDGFAGTVTNAGQADIWGLELEAVAQMTDQFSATGSLGYIDAEYKRWLVNDVDISADRVFQNTPEWMGNVTLRYEWPVAFAGNGGSLALIGSASYRDDTSQFEIPEPLLDQDAYTLVDASLVWSSSDGRYRVGLHGKNLTDKEYKVAGYNFPTLGAEGVVSAFYGNPRTITGTMSVRFGQ